MLYTHQCIGVLSLALLPIGVRGISPLLSQALSLSILVQGESPNIWVNESLKNPGKKNYLREQLVGGNETELGNKR